MRQQKEFHKKEVENKKKKEQKQRLQAEVWATLEQTRHVTPPAAVDLAISLLLFYTSLSPIEQNRRAGGKAVENFNVGQILSPDQKRKLQW